MEPCWQQFSYVQATLTRSGVFTALHVRKVLLPSDQLVPLLSDSTAASTAQAAIRAEILKVILVRSF